MRRSAPLLAILTLAFGLAAAPRHLDSRTALSPDFVHFESAHVHPAVLTPSGGRLLVVNTPNDRLAVFDLMGARPVLRYDLPVGLEPVAVAAPSDSVVCTCTTPETRSYPSCACSPTTGSAFHRTT